MKKLLLLLILGAAGTAHAYQIRELREDCQAAEQLFAQEKNLDTSDSQKANRCISYIAGFADGYAISEYLAEKVGVQLSAFCLPRDNDLPRRLVRAVQAHLEYLPKDPAGSTATIVAGALARSFSCTNTLESKK
jgi:hypothetical protein